MGRDGREGARRGGNEGKVRMKKTYAPSALLCKKGIFFMTCFFSGIVVLVLCVF